MPRAPVASAAADVDAFVAACGHALTAELAALRRIVKRAAGHLIESVKWNAPSYRLPDGDDVLTFNLSARDRVRLVFHRGAKATASTRGAVPRLADDGGLLEWPARDRAIATFRSAAEVSAAKSKLTALVRAWVGARSPKRTAPVR